ncbi:hypothetical protein BJ944DRAFT_168748 [Cunninghamella echinulata]|nr:hypothetical protein BJ944DRAFT_168748 [Cunninghamella echinulata]
MLSSLSVPSYPPYYSSSDTLSWTSPLFFTPTFLFIFIFFSGLIRYIQTSHDSTITRSLTANNNQLSALGKLISLLSLAVLFSFLGDAIVLISRALIESTWTSMTLAYYITLSYLAWTLSVILATYEIQLFGQWEWIQYSFWFLATFLDLTVAWLWIMGIKHAKEDVPFTIYDKLWLGLFIIRFTIEAAIFILSLIHMFTTPSLSRQDQQDQQRSLLQKQAPGYGSTSSPSTSSNNNNNNNNNNATGKEQSGLSNFFSKLKQVFPYIWPYNDKKLQFYVFLCFLLMTLGLVVNVYTPRQIGIIVDQLSEGSGRFAWAAVMVYIGLRFLQGSSGFIQATQNFLWIPVQQYTTREISVKMFSHLHALSLAFHINRKTGEVLRVMDRGTNSVVQLLQQVVFAVFPAIANILVAVVVFAFQFSIPFSFIVFITMALYLYVTIRLTEWRTKFRRDMNQLDNQARTKAVDSLLNFETVKYYGAEQFEVDRYETAIIDFQKADWKCSISLNVLNLAQNAVITLGLMVGSLLFVWEVAEGRLSVGDFVMFNMYMMQLYTPLHFFGTYYRMIQQNFIDMEKMLELFDEKQAVQDAPDAQAISVKKGEVVFDNVVFGYDERQTALKGVSFKVPAGSTVALVGPSGSGKSTILRLLFRFYDPTSGNIYIDGQNIRHVKQDSLRKAIGVVPQDTVLFNDTIMYNLRYGDIHASDEKIIQAAKSAQIHDSILGFPDQYETKVGERGLRLSGGEKQRMAIARTIIKDPPIILLDEATSALDTTTERHIQDALTTMSKGKTTICIAHRLSTIQNADIICVIKDGQVVEMGSHEELIRKATNGEGDGIYYEMWQKQLYDENNSTVDNSDSNDDIKDQNE